MIPRYLLDATAYTSVGWFDCERARLFTERWSLVASTDELTEAGAFVTATIGNAPVVVIRGDDAELRAFHNICRHRGMELLAGSGVLDRSVACFYHQWRYSLAGSLEAVPQRKEQFPDLDPADLGLRPASIEVWEGMVFVHPDPDAAALATSLAGVADHLGSHQPGQLTQLVLHRLDVRCNWKLFVENHVDVYHLWHLHASTLGGFDHTRFQHEQTEANWASYEPRRADAHPLGSTSMPAIGHLDDRDRDGLGAHLVFPNLMMATSSTFFATYMAHPLAPDRCVVELRIRGERDADPASLLGAALSFIEEDVRACEAVQRAIGSPAFSVGPLALDHERPIEAFHACVLEAMGNVAESQP